MPRPRRPRCLRFKPNVHYFKPQGVPLRFLGEETLLPDELEALKLHEVDGLEQKKAALKMEISQPHRIDQKGHGFGRMPWGYRKR